eukprot:scaffold20.g7741.t1
MRLRVPRGQRDVTDLSWRLLQSPAHAHPLVHGDLSHPLRRPCGEAAMDLEHASRKIWLVKASCKSSDVMGCVHRPAGAGAAAPSSLASRRASPQVPGFVAKRWHGICDQSQQAGEAVGPKLGTIQHLQVAAPEGSGPASFRMELSLDNELTKGIPQTFEMVPTTQNTAPMLAFSMDLGGSTAAEGRVQQKFDLNVARRAAPGAGAAPGAKVEIDPEYRKLSRERHQAAAVKSRTVQYVKDTRLVGAPTTVAIGSKRKAPADKRLATDAQQLTTDLFRLFERQPRWSFAQLQKHTDQPTQHLKARGGPGRRRAAVLSQIAVQNKRGPYRDLWELQKGYRAQPEEQAAPAPAQQKQQQQQQQAR